MRVIANGTLLNKLRYLDIFKLDLGSSLIDRQKEQIDIKDGFVYKYFTMYGKQILKYGDIGKLEFYQDFTLSDKKYVIFNSDKVYNVDYTKDEQKLNIEEHLSNIIQEIEETEGAIHIKEEVKPKKNSVDISLPKDQYIQEMIKKRNS